MYADGAKLGATQGAILEGGHVNKAPDLSLSPWGYLHKLKGCEHIYQADETGKTHEYVVTDVWTVPHEKLVDTEVYVARDWVLRSGVGLCNTGVQKWFTF